MTYTHRIGERVRVKRCRTKNHTHDGFTGEVKERYTDGSFFVWNKSKLTGCWADKVETVVWGRPKKLSVRYIPARGYRGGFWA